jgi:predicted acetyltransferase
MDIFSLTPASTGDGFDVLEMLHEIGPGENGFRMVDSPSVEEVPGWLQSRIDMERGLNLPPDKVPMTTFWLRRNGYPIGISKLRPRLNEVLLKIGGHIGFCIRPSERGKGYAKEILMMTVRYARQMRMDRLLLTCEKNNDPSWRTIESCGGQLERIENDERYYWI